MASRLEISGPAIEYWTDLRDALALRHLTPMQVRYIEAIRSEEFIPDAPDSLTGKSRWVTTATIVLHTSERLPIGEVRMIYDGGPQNEPL